MGTYADDLESMADMNPDAAPDLLAAVSEATNVWGPKVRRQRDVSLHKLCDVKNMVPHQQLCTAAMRHAPHCGLCHGAPLPLIILQALLLAGLRLEEVAVTREIMDAIGAAEVKVVPCTADMLHSPLCAALAAPEPQWDKPRLADAALGGGWGSQRVALFSGLR